MSIVRTPFADLPTSLVTGIADAGLDPRRVYDGVVDALAEDVPGVDVTAEATVPVSVLGRGDLTARAGGVLAGGDVAEMVLRFVGGGHVTVTRPVADGSLVETGDVVMTVRGPLRSLLTSERTALNYLGHLSGVATRTRAWADALEGTPVRVRDTRSTTPHLRALEKYAVRCGGGLNRRETLSDGALVGAGHILCAGGAVAAYEAVRHHFPELPVQVEVRTLEQLSDLLAAGAEEVLLVDMDAATMAEAVAINVGQARLEARGQLTLESAREVAGTGVHLLAVGSLTHSAPALDFVMDLSLEGGSS